MVHGKTLFTAGIAALKHRLVPSRCAFGVMVKPDALRCGESRSHDARVPQVILLSPLPK